MTISGYEYKEGYWETKDHKIIKIEDMETSHIENTIKFLQNRPDFYDEEYGDIDIFDIEGCFYEHIYNKKLVDKKIKELELELRFRRLERNTLVKENQRLNNIINELEKYLQKRYKELNTNDDFDRYARLEVRETINKLLNLKEGK